MESVAVRRAAVAALVLTAVLVVAVFSWRQRGRGTGPARERVFAPAGVRVKVEVINATRSRGLARRATFVLRDAGFDVVRFTTDTLQRDTTLVLSRSGHDDWARLVLRALGTGRTEARPDSSRYLDVTVLIGSDWRPPAKPFYP